MRILTGFLAWLIISAPSFALGIGDLSSSDATSGLKDALTQGSAAAIGKLGVTDGFLGNAKAKIENYVTQKALDGLFLMIAEQEKAIRKDPVGAATGMAQKVFGLLGK